MVYSGLVVIWLAFAVWITRTASLSVSVFAEPLDLSAILFLLGDVVGLSHVLPGVTIGQDAAVAKLAAVVETVRVHVHTSVSTLCMVHAIHSIKAANHVPAHCMESPCNFYNRVCR